MLVKSARNRLRSRVSARELPRPRKWNATCVSRRVWLAVRRSFVRQTYVGPTQPASVGAGE